MEPVHLRGNINRKKANGAIGALQFSKEVHLHINSTGGFLEPVLSILHACKDARARGVTIHTHIENADSMAAVLALNAGPLELRTMSSGGAINFHLGNIILEWSDFDLQTGKIIDPILVRFREYKKLLDKVLDEYKLSSNIKAMTELYASNWMRVPAKKCFDLGMISRLI